MAKETLKLKKNWKEMKFILVCLLLLTKKQVRSSITKLVEEIPSGNLLGVHYDGIQYRIIAMDSGQTAHIKGISNSVVYFSATAPITPTAGNPSGNGFIVPTTITSSCRLNSGKSLVFDSSGIPYIYDIANLGSNTFELTATTKFAITPFLNSYISDHYQYSYCTMLSSSALDKFIFFDTKTLQIYQYQDPTGGTIISAHRIDGNLLIGYYKKNLGGTFSFKVIDSNPIGAVPSGYSGKDEYVYPSTVSTVGDTTRMSGNRFVNVESNLSGEYGIRILTVDLTGKQIIELYNGDAGRPNKMKIIYSTGSIITDFDDSNYFLMHEEGILEANRIA